MASAITLKGIEQAVSQLKYTNENTLKYRFLQLIKDHYVDEHSLASLKKIDHTTLINLLWDTDDNSELIKNKRKSLNSIRSSVNADLKKLYKNGLNPEGIKIGSDNIFVMSEDAKDNILNTFGYDLQPDEALKLDQIMDILKLANETISGTFAVDDTMKTDGFRIKDQLKDLIKGLSEKLGLGNPNFETAGVGLEGQQSDDRVPPVDIGKDNESDSVDEDNVSSESEDIEEEAVLEAVADIEENEILEEIENVDDDDILDDLIEDIVMDDTGYSGPETEVETDLPDEDIEETETDTELDYVDVVDKNHVGSDVGAGPSSESETGVGDISEGLSHDQGSGQGKTGHGHDEQGAMTGDLITGTEAGDKSGGEGISFDSAGKSNESGFDAEEVNEVLDDVVSDAKDGIMELDDLEEIETIDEEDISDDIEDIVMDDTGYSGPDAVVEADMSDEVIEETETDTELDYVDAVDENPVGDGVGGALSEISGAGGNEKEREVEQLGLPIDSLGQDYGSEKGAKLKKEKLLAEAFDGYLGSMDRYYNHYILIDGGEYSVGSRYPKKDEKPEQIVRLNPFYLGRFPVTNGLFEIFVEKTGYRTTAEKVGDGTVYYGRFEKKIDNETGRITSRWNASLYCEKVKGACWYHPTGPESTIHNKRNHPVVQISFEDAAAFAAWTGKRLPTENEWEAASRTANGLIFPWGEEWKNDACNIEESSIADTTPVDKYIEFENDFGIVDVLGNVLEWTSDGFKVVSQENYETIFQIAKGGSWVSGNDIRLYSRFKIVPDSYSNVLGFRCVAY